MQVIRHGTKWSDEFPKQKMCNECKCVFLYDKEDIKTTFYKNLCSPPARDSTRLYLLSRVQKKNHTILI